jgi:hypothetical protein
MKLNLSQESGYRINIEQSDEAVYEYMLGSGTNQIDIKQRQ